MLARLRERQHAENFLRGARVNVFAAAKGFDEDRVFGKMREDAQLDLRIIRGKKQAARRSDEGGADFAAELGADGNILQIGIRGAEAAGDRAGLAEARVQAAGDWMDQARQSVRVGGFHFGELAIFENFFGQFVQERQFFKHFGGGGAAFRRGCGEAAARFSLSKRTSASCCGELILNSKPASS